MSDCCTTTNTIHSKPKKHLCPANGKPYAEVSAKTMMHHLQQTWQWQNKNQGYYFCDDPDCDVVYFGEDDSVINQSQLRTRVGIKQQSADSMLCYCFGVTKQDFIKNPNIKDYVITMTKTGICACETSNPSGRCCLKYF